MTVRDTDRLVSCLAYNTPIRSTFSIWRWLEILASR